jgi:hypothetical protein
VQITSYPIRLKVIAVDGEHLACLEFLGGDDERRIGEIHRPVRISFIGSNARSSEPRSKSQTEAPRWAMKSRKRLDPTLWDSRMWNASVKTGTVVESDSLISPSVS